MSDTSQVDFIGDIHGYADHLEKLLKLLQYDKINGAYKHPERMVLFVGDYIDRGADSPRVVNIVRNMVDAGSAVALCGNHEFNAICFNTMSKNGFIRPHLIKNFKQHSETLIQYLGKQSEYNDAIEWFKTLPLFIETKSFRAVHATWDNSSIKYLSTNLQQGTLSPEQYLEFSNEESQLFKAVEITCKGKEAQLPKGISFFDKDGTERYDIRLKWWQNPEGLTVKEMSVIENLELGNELFDAGNMDYYKENEKPVFFGHYWLKGKPKIFGDNICCLDFSVAKGGHLVAYRYSGEKKLSNQNLVYI